MLSTMNHLRLSEHGRPIDIGWSEAEAEHDFLAGKIMRVSSGNIKSSAQLPRRVKSSYNYFPFIFCLVFYYNPYAVFW